MVSWPVGGESGDFRKHIPRARDRESTLGHVMVEGAIRIGDNKGESTFLDRCPWPRDGICDATSGTHGPGTALCVLDWEDCE